MASTTLVISGSNHQTTKRHFHKSVSHSQMDFECLEKIHNNKLLCDVVLVAEGKEIPAHKLILGLSSTFFYFKFASDRGLGMLNRILIDNVTFETLSAVVTYLYRSEVLITVENVEQLLEVAYMFVLRDLQKACHVFLRKNLNTRNCVQTGKVARKYRCEELFPVVNNYMLTHFSEIIRHDECYDMAYDDVLDLISNDALCTSEENVLECVIKWVRHDLQQRKQYLYSLMHCVRFSLIPQKNILQKLSEEKWLESDSAFQLFLWKMFKCSILEEKNSTKPRQPSKLLVVAVVANGYWNIEMFDLQKNIWMNWPNSNIIRRERLSCAAFLGLKIYYIEGGTLKSIDISNPAKMTVSDCGQIMENRERYGIAAHNNSIYIVGGYSNATFMATAEVFDTSSGQFKKIGSMSEAKRSIGVGIMNGKLYAAGGKKKMNGTPIFCNTVECYTPATDTWHTLPNMSVERCQSAVAALGDTLYVIGGASNVGTCRQVESFNPDEYSWKRLPDMNVPRCLPGVSAVNGQIYVIGGCNAKAYLNSAEVYDPKSNAWSMLPILKNNGTVTVTVVDREVIKS